MRCALLHNEHMLRALLLYAAALRLRDSSMCPLKQVHSNMLTMQACLGLARCPASLRLFDPNNVNIPK
jgi:hypothetical protein